MSNNLKEYLKHETSISYLIFNPPGFGMTEIILIPPAIPNPNLAWTLIFNEEDVLPIRSSWAILLRYFMKFLKDVSIYRELTPADVKTAADETLKKAQNVFSYPDGKLMRSDLRQIFHIIMKICTHEELPDIGYMKLKDYIKYIKEPFQVDLMVSSSPRCENYSFSTKCMNCHYNNKPNNNESLSTEEWKKIIDQLCQEKIPVLTFTGGEPTLRKDLVELVEHASWFITKLNTNGENLTQKLCEDLYKANLNLVHVTLYSHDKDIHNKIIGSDGFDKTIEGIKNAIDAKLSVIVDTPLCHLNKNYVDTIKFLHENYGLRIFNCSGMVLSNDFTSNNNIDNRLSCIEYEKILTEALMYCKKQNIELKITSRGCASDDYIKRNGLISTNCLGGSAKLAISPSGELLPCVNFDSEHSFGNLLDTNIKSLLKNNEIMSFRNKVVNTKYTCPIAKEDLLYEKNNK